MNEVTLNKVASVVDSSGAAGYAVNHTLPPNNDDSLLLQYCYGVSQPKSKLNVVCSTGGDVGWSQ
jgi:hypothetical protein